MSTCPFCDLELIPEQKVILSNKHCYFIQMPQPVLEGSGVIVPRMHRENVFDLAADEWQATYSLLMQVKKMLDLQFRPSGYNVGWNCGEIGGQEIFHSHLHVVPRFPDEPLARKGIRWFIKQTENLRPSYARRRVTAEHDHCCHLQKP